MHRVGIDPYVQRGLITGRSALEPDRQQHQRYVGLELDLLAEQVTNPLCDQGIGLDEKRRV